MSDADPTPGGDRPRSPEVPVFDGHNDALLDVHLEERGGGRSFFERSETGHLDLPRAREGGLCGGVFAVFVPNEGTEYEIEETDEGWRYPLADAVDHDRAREFTDDVLAHLYRIERASEGAVRVCRSVEAIEDAREAGALAAVPHLEGAAAVAPDLSNLDLLYAMGVRSIGLVWSRPNAFGHGVPFEFPGTPDVGPGLTDAGKRLVDACNDRGVVVDLAHLNEAGFFDVAERSTDPLVVSHAGAHAMSPSSRTLTDEQIDAVGDSGGVVGVTFAVSQLHPEGESEGLELSTLADHVAHVADRIGVDGVALGSDFDGATIPDAVGDATGLPAVVEALRERGFDDGDLARIARDNWLRVFRETWNE